MIKSAYSYFNNVLKWLATDDWTDALDEINLCGSRKSGKTYAVDHIISLLMGLIVGMSHKKVAIYGFRYNSTNAQEMKKDIQQALDLLGLVESSTKNKIKDGHYKYSNTNNKPLWVFPNGSFIQLTGVYKSNGQDSTKGLSRCEGFDLSVDWKEEANEFGAKEFQSIANSVRGAKHRLDIRSSNPDSIFQYYIQYCNNNVPFNESVMAAKGQQLQIIDETYASGFKKRKLFHYSNYMVNAHNLQDWELAEFSELAKLDPIKFRVWGLGMPGGIETSIFERYLKSQFRTFTPTQFYGGIDIGQANSPNGHPLHAVLASTTGAVDKVFFEREYYHSNATMTHKNTYELAADVMKFYSEAFIDFPIMRVKGLTVYIDYGGGGLSFIDVLNKMKKDLILQGSDLEWLHFEAVEKSTWYIKDRIDIYITLMSTNQLLISKQATPELYKSMSLMEWKPPSNNSKTNYKLEPLDRYDDGFDASYYSIANIVQRLIKNLNPLLLNKKFYK